MGKSRSDKFPFFFFNEMVHVSSTILVQDVGETGVEIAALQAGFSRTHE